VAFRTTPWLDELISSRAVPESIRQQVLRRAAEAIGRENLADLMKVPVPLLDTWLAGHATLPDRKFVALTDILDKRARGKLGESGKS
jgi:hypothetical protein